MSCNLHDKSNGGFPIEMTNMAAEKERIEKRLVKLQEEIAETLRRLPAHSVKPPVMIDLLALEDERDHLLQQLGDMG